MIERVYLLSGSSLVIVLTALVLIASVLGSAIGRRLRAAPPLKSELDTLLGSVLGVYGLLLGFTLSMAVSRYDARKVATVEESNAIGTAFLRANLLPAEHARSTRLLLTDYVNVDIEFFNAISDPQGSAKITAQLERLQDQLWGHAQAAAALNPQSLPTSLFVQSLNAIIDTHAVRIATLRNQLPPVLLLLLSAFALVGAGLTGYASGLAGPSDRVPALISALIMVAVLVVVFDIDRPRQGYITLGQRSMLELRDYMMSH